MFVVKMTTQFGSGTTHLVIILLLATVLVRKGDSVSFPAMIMFGDSTMDVGTNNYLETLVKSNFKPYGRDLSQSQMATGRFSDGFIVPDFVAQYFGLKSALAYLDPKATGEELLCGINFASSGTGWLESTAEIFLVRSFKQQLEDFKNYKNNLIAVVGSSKAADLISNALYIVSAGSNDFVNNYFLVERDHYTISQWREQIKSNAYAYLQEIYNAGARKIVVASLPSIGCLPAAITLYGEGKNDCVDYVNEAAINTNLDIQNIVINLQSNMQGVKFLFLDIYDDLLKAFQNPPSYGFQVARYACCGTGTIEVAILCNADSPGTCSDASKYIFFDSFHPTSKFYKGVAEKAIDQILVTFASP